MFGLGMTEIMLIAVVALVVVGPKKLPEIAKSIGKGYAEFRRSFSELKSAVDLNAEDTNKNQETIKKDLVDNYKSQWEQKLPEPKKIEAEVKADVKTEEKKEEIVTHDEK